MLFFDIGASASSTDFFDSCLGLARLDARIISNNPSSLRNGVLHGVKKDKLKGTKSKLRNAS